MTKELIEQSNTVSSFAWALIMETAASFEVASYSISDEDAKKSAEGAIKYARYMANKYYTSPPKQAIPDGWMLVPIKATESMLQAAIPEIRKYESIQQVYEAMLNAAPKETE